MHRATMSGGQRCQRGLALITAVLVVAIVATISAYVALGQQVWQRQALNMMDRAQADKVVQGSVQYVIVALTKDGKEHGESDHYGEEWAIPLAAPVEGGLAVGQIVDAQARFNLNNLWHKGQPSKADIGVFQRIVKAVAAGGDDLADALIDWMDNDDQVRPGGAEDIYYLSRQPPYRAANQLLTSVDELRLIKGFTPDIVEKLAPHVIALPQHTPVNVNTADAIVLSALFNDMTPADAERLVSERPPPDGKKAYSSKDDFKSRARQPLADESIYDVKSNYFIVAINTQFGRLQRAAAILLDRSGQGKGAHVIWQTNDNRRYERAEAKQQATP